MASLKRTTVSALPGSIFRAASRSAFGSAASGGASQGSAARAKEGPSRAMPETSTARSKVRIIPSLSIDGRVYTRHHFGSREIAAHARRVLLGELPAARRRSSLPLLHLHRPASAYSIPPPAPGEGDPQLHRDDAGVLAAVAVVRVRVGGRVAAVVPTAGPAPSRRRRRDFVIAAPIIRTLREIHRRDRLHHQLEHDPARKRAR